MKLKVYCIKNQKGTYRTNDGFWVAFPQCTMFATRKRADEELAKIYSRNMERYRSEPLKELLLWQVVEMEMDVNELESFSNKDRLVDALVRQEIDKKVPAFVHFWENLIKQGVSQKVEYLIRVKALGRYYTPSKEQLKEIRDTIRLLGVKTNQYRSQGYNFAFNSADEAMKARLCLDIDEFLDIKELKAQARERVEAGS